MSSGKGNSSDSMVGKGNDSQDLEKEFPSSFAPASVSFSSAIRQKTFCFGHLCIERMDEKKWKKRFPFFKDLFGVPGGDGEGEGGTEKK
ncbi:hypothetical protein L249_7200 [Ophiocordyceps polyrhachis-furcata BCC 54312]|uniref:Uncharacterized protein n=1 Tax=Ophiocordyceps polyrhachis-furcata BCC 54312 TaxID=1330021 RepID=A0A367LA49_9HYPO|nr:hypothetical protein L249_7200 [Ophiocordyceps polyrhachis-furcata BCC 54312]